MALDITVSGTASDSYVTVDEYKEYAKTFLGNDRDSTDTAEIEQHLRRGVQLLDKMFYWIGYKTVDKQALEFPRIIRYWTVSVDSDTIPADIKRGQMELADAIASGIDIAPIVSSGAVIKEVLKAGPASLETQYSQPALKPILTGLRSIVSNFIVGSQYQVPILLG